MPSPKSIKDIQKLVKRITTLTQFVSNETLTIVLIKEMSNGQLSVYYISKTLHTSKLNYIRIKKLAYSLLMASCKLRQYFQSHHVVVLIDQLFKEVLQKMTTSKKMIKWNIELCEYSLEFRPRQFIKAQALADFIAKCSFYNQLDLLSN